MRRKQFKEDIDAWIKQIRKEFAELSELLEIKDEIDDLKQEINALKLIQIISLKQKVRVEEHGRLDKSRMARLDR